MSFLKIKNCNDKQLLSILKTIINEIGISTGGSRSGHYLRLGLHVLQTSNVEAVSDRSRINTFDCPGHKIIDGFSNREILSVYKNLFETACAAMEMNYSKICEKYIHQIMLINALVYVELARIDDFDLSCPSESSKAREENGVYLASDFVFNHEKTIHDIESEQILVASAVFKPTEQERAKESFESSHRQLRLDYAVGSDGKYIDQKTRALWSSFNIGILYANQKINQERTVQHQDGLDAELEIEYQSRYLMSIDATPLSENDVFEIRDQWGLRSIPEFFAGLCDVATHWIVEMNPFEDEGLYASNIKSVYLVGSRAKGNSNKDSDFDVAIIYSSSIRNDNELPSAIKLSELLHAKFGNQMPNYCKKPVDIQIFFDDDKELINYSMIQLHPGPAYQFYDEDLDKLPPIVVAAQLAKDEISFESMVRHNHGKSPLSVEEKQEIKNKYILETTADTILSKRTLHVEPPKKHRFS